MRGIGVLLDGDMGKERGMVKVWETRVKWLVRTCPTPVNKVM